MPSTLVISDLHIGARGRVAVLERGPALERLLAALEVCERLVLLGDVVELLGSRPRAAIEAAVRVLGRIGARLGPDREAVIVPGNHDRPLVRGWVRRVGPGLAREATVPLESSPLLARLAQALAPARVRASYPGVWLADGVWATHGHYLDRHLFPVSAYGVVRGRRDAVPERRVSPWAYERAARPHLSPVVRWLPEPLAAAADGFGDVLRATTMPAVKRTMSDPRLSPLTARVLGTQMRRHSLPAMARVARELSVEADSVVFGHVHRLGPLEADDPGEWMAPDGGLRLVNTGSWLYEPRLVSRLSPPHPYWPGGAVWVGPDGGAPRTLTLLDDLGADDLRGAGTVAHER